MTKIDEKLVKKIADIARLNLSESETQTFKKDFNDILEHFSILDEVNTDNIKPSIQPIRLKDVLREDIPQKNFDQKTALSQTKNKKDNYFRGPKII